MANILIYCLIILLFSRPAYAYLDPGLGSLILQSVIGGVAIVVGYISFFWHKIKSFILKLRRDFKSKYINK